MQSWWEAEPEASPTPGKVKAKKVVIMVDPLEAKRLVGKEMEEIKGRGKQQRRREIEAINGAWAIIGLLIGLVIEAQTGKGIVAQLAGYWSAVVHLFIPSTQNLPQLTKTPLIVLLSIHLFYSKALREALAQSESHDLHNTISPMRPIGTVQSCFSTRNGTPRQPLLVSLARACLIFNPALVPHASLEGLGE
ncbi:unnamed protein product [Thlaspi arvense]|uniref:TsaA-like domain-containing protein n=1 Tax=Thlaspi arvense TaxID=13288 RepID=A0AAU9T372_THLAR|nr:unnamed protein product [Thlaspi arvense]